MGWSSAGILTQKDLNSIKLNLEVGFSNVR